MQCEGVQRGQSEKERRRRVNGGEGWRGMIGGGGVSVRMVKSVRHVD